MCCYYMLLVALISFNQSETPENSRTLRKLEFRNFMSVFDFPMFDSIWGEKVDFSQIWFTPGETPMRGQIDAKWDLMSHQRDYSLLDIWSFQGIFFVIKSSIAWPFIRYEIYAIEI